MLLTDARTKKRRMPGPRNGADGSGGTAAHAEAGQFGVNGATDRCAEAEVGGEASPITPVADNLDLAREHEMAAGGTGGGPGTWSPWALDPELLSAIDARSSRLPGFYRLPAPARQRAVALWAALDAGEEESLFGGGGLGLDRADSMIENAIGAFGLPLGIATNLRVNGCERLVPMAVEEPSVVAAASFGALLARHGGGFTAQSDAPLMIGQIQVLDLPRDDLEAAATALHEHREAVLAAADSRSRSLPALGGGAKDLETRLFPATPVGPMLVVHLLYDTRDAMGANAVNTACEAVAPLVEGITGGRVLLRILSNLASHRRARANCRVPAEALGRKGLLGADVARRIVEAGAFAEVDPWRAATHNKGVMNGIDPVVIATGNDWRAVEAGAHAWAARDGAYGSLTRWRLDDAGDLVGSIELPLALGTVGGGTRAHPAARAALKILDVRDAGALAEVVASVGLAQNLSALRALACEGIQPGHMALHARQVALSAGASGTEASRIAERMVSEGVIKPDRAREVLLELRSKR